MAADDRNREFRCAHHNPDIKKLYDDFLGKPLGETARKYLHTSYTPRPRYAR